MIIKEILLLCIVSISVYTDIKENKIKNKYLIVALILGLAISLITDGIAGTKDSILGIIVPFIMLFLFFVMRMFGAGDIKLFCTIGAIMGLNFVLNNIIYSFFLAGIVVIAKIIFTGQLFKIIKGLYYYFKAMFLNKTIIEFYGIEENKFPFGIAIFLGTVVQLVVKYNFI